MLASELSQGLAGSDFQDDVLFIPDDALQRLYEANRLAQLFGPVAAVLQVVQGSSNPFFSPDGRWIGLFNDNAVVKVPVDGGPLVRVVPNTNRPRGAVWLDDDTIVYATTEGLFQVAAAGGESRLLKRPNRDRGELAFAWPQAIPDTRAVLILVDEAGGVFQAAGSPAGMVTMSPWTAPSDLGGRVVSAVGSDVNGDIYLVVETGSDAASVSSQVIRLRRP